MKKVILYPTDTLYGLGVDATDPEAVLRLFDLKERELDKPISIVVSDMAMMEEYAEVTPLARKIAETFLPGKVTLVLNARNLAPELSAGTGTVGIRIPDHPVPIALVQEMGRPITATSANVSGMKPEMNVKAILKQFGDKQEMVDYDDDIPPSLPESEPSTVVDARGTVLVTLREGAITKEMILHTVE
ncbi:threonylcarbamoyl-AMP synthase [Candidatus Kaiserbacteria bacterium CG10_big_fil_rev_8_21_14_0_10_45_20]|uniref:L-threonylcarbamoyladenylate synthase n=1 Tax=Candidatus Kaiserbacteria bacterium CG10_big_fil_rev_8_21_14_0_10_45_20 TaxID=1974607 RepID=A0A2H0UHU2_9BACT|nr:MAG: threonylcarbamoyl-AMP synthase [Candidatus Kaiserbacteria bacterium CG10_big_fil_rev_8_21_14_0_10_45_20]